MIKTITCDKVQIKDMAISPYCTNFCVESEHLEQIHNYINTLIKQMIQRKAANAFVGWEYLRGMGVGRQTEHKRSLYLEEFCACGDCYTELIQIHS